jgi:hypothetical protein
MLRDSSVAWSRQQGIYASGHRPTDADRGLRFRLAGSGRRPLSARRSGRPQRQLGNDRGPPAEAAVHLDRPTQGVNAVTQAEETGPSRRIGPAHAVVDDRQAQSVIVLLDRDTDTT